MSLLPQSILMSSDECKSGRNVMRVKLFNRGTSHPPSLSLSVSLYAPPFSLSCQDLFSPHPHPLQISSIELLLTRSGIRLKCAVCSRTQLDSNTASTSSDSSQQTARHLHSHHLPHPPLSSPSNHLQHPRRVDKHHSYPPQLSSHLEALTSDMFRVVPLPSHPLAPARVRGTE